MSQNSPEIMKRAKWVPLSELPKQSDLEFELNPCDDFNDALEEAKKDESMSDFERHLLNLAQQGLKNAPPMKAFDPSAFRDFPLLMGNFRFPYNINTGEPTIDLNHIMINRKLMRAMNLVAMFTGSTLSEFHGGGVGI
ncbi:MAG: hypothetical protein LBM09_00025 [Candidatus Nomurabacteria bacterium]|jgi:hypothetical protein|nr:hypothetical protein [Candidatus Nomurabacteria bacterium]